ncbi:unnamed protein product [Allacma fusca]|uniref:Phospholipid scramblase n=1 Tax=Allacma fusca TaxID=39272 RepID=A0A8J2JH88_9HEXA|nr:unnamed protein product [Allacma fusca]
MHSIHDNRYPTKDLGRLPPGQFSYNNSIYPSVPLPPLGHAPAAFNVSTQPEQPIVTQPLGSPKESRPKSASHPEVIQEQPPSKRSQMPVQVQQGIGNLNFNRQSSLSISQPISYMMTSIPRGLEYLATLDRLFVRQKVELLEVFLGCERKNRYQIFDASGHEIFYAKEETDFCTRFFCNNIRPFEMIIKDGHGEEVIHLKRPLACGSCLFPCCLQSIEVEAPPGNRVGTVQQEWAFCIPHYNVKNGAGEVSLHIKGPFCTSSCCSDVEFLVLTSEQGSEVGRISKQWSGIAREFFTDADNFGLSFPIDLDVKMKAVMIGACMLIDFMFFEHNHDN